MNYKYPKLKIEPIKLWSYINYTCIFIILFSLVYTYLSYSELPDQIPIHYNAKGEVNSYGDKSIIWLLPISSILNYILLTVLSRYPHTFNYTVKITEKNAESQYAIAIEMMVLLKLSIVLFFGYLTYVTIQIAIGSREGIGLFSTVALLLAIAGISIRSFIKSYESK